MKTQNIKTLYLTFEYGKTVLGGIGRIINGVTEVISEYEDIDMLLFHWSFLHKDFYFDLFEARNGKVNRKRLWGNYKKSLEKRLTINTYENIHILHTGETLKECIKVIQAFSPNSKIIYSCNSILKYESGIRRNYESSENTEEYILENSHIIHVNNKTCLGYLKESYPQVAAEKDIAIIPNGITDKRFIDIDKKFLKRLKKEIQPQNKKVVLCMSRWSHGKGLEQLLDAAPAVIEKNPDVMFVIAGRKKVSWEKDCTEFVQKINAKVESLKDNVYVLGWINDSQRNALYTITDVYVMPSLIEYFPYSILEPMIGKLPIVSSRIGCVDEMLEDGKECFMYHPTKPAELTKKLLELLDNKEMQNTFVENCYRKVTQKYSWDKVAKAYLDMYSAKNDVKLQIQLEDEVLHCIV